MEKEDWVASNHQIIRKPNRRSEKENQVLKETLTSKLDMNNENNIDNNNIDNTWERLKSTK